MARHINVIVRKKKRPKNAIDERSDPTLKKKVNIIQPTCELGNNGSDTDEVMPKRSIQLGNISVRTGDIEERDKDACETDPESTVRAERQSTEGIATSKFPHSGADLGETTVRKG